MTTKKRGHFCLYSFMEGLKSAYAAEGLKFIVIIINKLLLGNMFISVLTKLLFISQVVIE
jgi:hypothetical protein